MVALAAPRRERGNPGIRANHRYLPSTERSPQHWSSCLFQLDPVGGQVFGHTWSRGCLASSDLGGGIPTASISAAAGQRVTSVGSSGTWDAAISGDRGEKQGRKEKLRPAGDCQGQRGIRTVKAAIPVPQGSPGQRVSTVCRLGGLMCPGAEDVQRPQGGWSQCWRGEGRWKGEEKGGKEEREGRREGRRERRERKEGRRKGRRERRERGRRKGRWERREGEVGREGREGRKGWQGSGFREDIPFDLGESGSHGGWWAEEGGG